MPVRSHPLHSDCCGLSVRNFVKCRTFDFAEMKQWRSRDEKSFSHTRTWRNGRNRRGCEPNDGGRSMASWLSCRADWREGPSLALRLLPQGPIMRLTRTNPSISGRDVTSDASAFGTDGVGTIAA